MSANKFVGGIIVPLVTPFNEFGNLEADWSCSLIERQLELGVHGFYVGGSTGEGFFQSVAERCEYLRTVSQIVDGRGLLIAQVGALSARDAHEITRFASENRYDLISSTPPFYFQHTDMEVLNYYSDLAEFSDLPVLLYNIPKMTHRDVSTEILLQLLKIPNVIGSKHTDMNFFRAERLLRDFPDAKIFNGPDEMLVGGLAMGMVGGIGSTYNLMPLRYLEIYDAMMTNDLQRARKLQSSVNDVINELLRISPGVVPGIKLGLKKLGFDVGYPRKPFLPIEADSSYFESLIVNLDAL